MWNFAVEPYPRFSRKLCKNQQQQQPTTTPSEEEKKRRRVTNWKLIFACRNVNEWVNERARVKFRRENKSSKMRSVSLWCRLRLILTSLRCIECVSFEILFQSFSSFTEMKCGFMINAAKCYYIFVIFVYFRVCSHCLSREQEISIEN